MENQPQLIIVGGYAYFCSLETIKELVIHKNEDYNKNSSLYLV